MWEQTKHVFVAALNPCNLNFYASAPATAAAGGIMFLCPSVHPFVPDIEKASRGFFLKFGSGGFKD